MEKIAAAVSIHGKWWDEVFKKDPKTGEDKLVLLTPVQHNIICDKIAALMAGLFKNEGTFTGGILYHAFGEGLVAWDTSLPDPTSNQVKLVTELHRKTPTSMTYLDGSGNPTGTITGRLRVKTELDYAEPNVNNKYLREQGLFGGDATASADSGHIIDAINHLRIWKDSSIKLVRYIELQF